MPDISKLKELLERQNALAGEIAAHSAEYMGDKMVHELESLKAENETLRKSREENERQIVTLSEENRALNEALKNQLYAERQRFLRTSDARMAAYFDYDTAEARNTLYTFEKNMRNKFSELRRALDEGSADMRDQFDGRMTGLEADAARELAALRKSYKDLTDDANDAHRRHTSALEEKEIDDDTAGRVVRESDHKVERIVGLNVLGKIGAVIIIIGMIALSQLAYINFTEPFKCIFMFAAASLVLGFGLWLNRKKEKRNPFTITILSLGVALEYTALSVSYFTLSIFEGNVWAALGICIVITAVTYYIALRLKSEVVSSFAQVGGYLPVFAIYGDIGLIYGSMVYFLILSMLGFMLSVKYKWQVLNFIAFGLNILAVIYVAVSVAVMYGGYPFNLAKGLSLGFIFVSFALHTLLPLITNIRVKSQFTRSDLILMGIATTCNLVLFYTMFAAYDIREYSGWLSVFFAAFYFGIYLLAVKFFKTDTTTRTLFWLTGIVLLGLFIPMHYADADWLTFGWILEGAALVIFALLRSRKFMFWTGVVISAAGLFSFMIFDIAIGASSTAAVDVFIYKYLMVTVASIAVLGVSIYKGKPILGCRILNGKRIFIEHKFTVGQAYAAAVYMNTAGFFLYSIWKLFDTVAADQIAAGGNIRYLMLSLMVLTLFAFAVLVPKLFKTVSVHRTSFLLFFAAFIFLIVVNSIPLAAFGSGGSGEMVAAAILTAVTTLASGYAFYDFFMGFSALLGKKPSGLIIALALYFLFWFTHLLLVQYRVRFTNLSFGIVYMVVALACLALGLYFKSPMTRRFALVVVGAAIFKLFVIDSFGLELIYRIICYFVFGAILIGMSYLYQLFYKKFTKTEKPSAVPVSLNGIILPPEVTGRESTQPPEETDGETTGQYTEESSSKDIKE